MERQKNIYSAVLPRLEEGASFALATILETEDGAPQVPGASALFSERGLVLGTLGGGAVEADSQKRAVACLRREKSLCFRLDLRGDIDSTEEAVCGGSVLILVDGSPASHLGALRDLKSALSARRPGILATRLEVDSAGGARVSRLWASAPEWQKLIDYNQFASRDENLEDVFRKGRPVLLRQSGAQGERGQTLLFLEPLSPLPRLVIAGAGHIGQALAHLAKLLDFEVTVIDDRAEYANPQRFPEADALLISKVEPALRRFSISTDTYIVIVTRGHSQDAEALNACIRSQAAYIGMIGSRRKIALMREKFLAEGWASAEEFDRVHAPIGLPIGSTTVAEIAVSIAAELVHARSQTV